MSLNACCQEVPPGMTARLDIPPHRLSAGPSSAWRLMGRTLGGAWALALVVLGLWAWRHQQAPPLLALGPLAAGQCLAMHWLADACCPRAPAPITAFLKLTAALVFFFAWGYAILLFTGRTGL